VFAVIRPCIDPTGCEKAARALIFAPYQVGNLLDTFGDFPKKTYVAYVKYIAEAEVVTPEYIAAFPVEGRLF